MNRCLGFSVGARLNVPLRAAALVASVLVALPLVLPGLGASAAALSRWTEPALLFDSSKGEVSDPVLVADSEGDLHLFFSSMEKRNTIDPNAGPWGAILYARLHRGRWSQSVEILSSPQGAATQPAAAIDRQGVLHVVWVGSSGWTPDLYYSRAHVTQAAGAGGWAPRQTLSEATLAPGTFGTPAAITVSADGALHVVYSTKGGTVAHLVSDDGGRSWPRRATVAESGSGSAPDHPRILVDGRGRLHVSWTELQMPSGWPPTGIFAARSLDSGSTWLEPTKIGISDYAMVNMAADGLDTVHRVWNARAGFEGRWHQVSTDGGETWSRPQNAAPGTLGGLTGFPGLTFDAAGTLHLITSVAMPPGSRTTEVVVHAQLEGSKWSTSTPISRGSEGRRSIERPAMAITLGNLLHAVWEDDFQRIWHTSRLVDAPTLPSRAIAPPPPPEPVESRPSRFINEHAAPPAPDRLGAVSVEGSADPGMPVALGAIASMLLIGCAFALRMVGARSAASWTGVDR